MCLRRHADEVRHSSDASERFEMSNVELTVPSRTKRPVAVVTGRAVAAVRAVFNTLSMLLPPCVDCVFRRTMPVIGRPDIVIGRMAGLGPLMPALGFAVGCRMDVPGIGAW